MSALYKGTTVGAVVGPASTVGGDGIVIVNSLTFTTAGSPQPTYELIDAGFRFTSLA